MAGNQRARAGVLSTAALVGVILAPSATAEIQVFACEPEWASLAEEVGGDLVSAYSATHGLQDPHHIRARPSLIAKIRRADLLFCSGAELEAGWLPVLMQRGAGKTVQPGQPGHLMATDYVKVLEKPEIIDRSLGDIHSGGNPHVHLDPRNIEVLASELAARLSRIDPANEAAYRSSLETFRVRWTEASVRWNEQAEALRGMKVIAHHKAWTYLFHWAGLEQFAVLERVPGIPPTVPHLQQILEQVRGATGIKAILRTPYEPTAAADWLSEKTGIPVVELPYTVGGHPDVENIYALFDRTLSLLKEAQNQP